MFKGLRLLSFNLCNQALIWTPGQIKVFFQVTLNQSGRQKVIDIFDWVLWTGHVFVFKISGVSKLLCICWEAVALLFAGSCHFDYLVFTCQRISLDLMIICLPPIKPFSDARQFILAEKRWKCVIFKKNCYIVFSMQTLIVWVNFVKTILKIDMNKFDESVSINYWKDKIKMCIYMYMYALVYILVCYLAFGLFNFVRSN